MVSAAVNSYIDEYGGDEGSWRFPLFLSGLAGASTCLGAAIVFVASPRVIKKSMSFSMSLAASVMVTVSCISILPESLHSVFVLDIGRAAGKEDFLSLFTWPVYQLLQRLLSFSGGCVGYWCLSKLAFPEPEDCIMEFNSLGAKNETQGGLTTVESSNGCLERGDNLKSYDELLNEGSPAKHSLRKKGSRTLTISSKGEENGVYSSDLPKSDVENGGSTYNPKSRIKSGTAGSIGAWATRQAPHTVSKLEYYFKKFRRWCQGDDLGSKEERRSWRVTLLLFVSLLCHNFPEGLAVVASTVQSRHLGITVAVGIIIHNIPEGIAIAVPCIAAKPDSPWLAFGLASASGMAEPLGAWLALSVMSSQQDSDDVSKPHHPLPMGNILACVAGIMISVAKFELYPEAFRHIKETAASAGRVPSFRDNLSIYAGTVCGIIIMVLTEWYI